MDLQHSIQHELSDLDGNIRDLRGLLPEADGTRTAAALLLFLSSTNEKLADFADRLRGDDVLEIADSPPVVPDAIVPVAPLPQDGTQNNRESNRPTWFTRRCL